MAEDISKKNARFTQRQRVSRKTTVKPLPTVTLPLPSKEEIFDEIFLYVVQLQKDLYQKHFKPVTVAGNNITLPRYFQYTYQKSNRSSHEFDAALQDIKLQLTYLGFTPTAGNFYLYKHNTFENLYIFIKRYTQANVLALYVMRFYNADVPSQLDLL